MEKTINTHPNHFIALFDGAKITTDKNEQVYDFRPEGRGLGKGITCVFYADLQYDTSWDWLMPVIRKFDTLHIGFKGSREVYKRHCDEIDGAVTRYDIKEAFIVFTKAVEWFLDYQYITNNSMVSSERPTHGIKPEWLWKEERLKELNEVILTRTDSGGIVPIEWVEERNLLIHYFNNRKMKDSEKGLE